MIKGTEKELFDQIHKRIMAYSRVFEEKSPFVQDVLSDLAKFCRADESCFHPDARVHAVLEGRRETFLRILNHIKLSPEEMLTRSKIKDPQAK